MNLRRPRLTLTLVLLAVAALALGGCGEDDADMSRAEYEERVSEASDDLDATVERVSGALGDVASGSASPDEATDEVAEIRSEIDRTADELRDTQPPADAEEANEQLVDGLDRLSGDLRSLEQAVEDEDVPELQEIVGRLGDLESLRDVSAALDRLAEAGYDVRT